MAIFFPFTVKLSDRMEPRFVATAIMSSVEPRNYGVGSEALETMRLIGQVASMSFAMMVFSLYLGDVEIIPQYYPQFLSSVKMAFGVNPSERTTS
jgi:hypothetical protein